MSTVSSSQSVDASEAPRYLPFLLLLFAASGCAALIYEIVWFQLLRAGDRLFRRSRWACCSAPSWAACAWAACCCRGSYRTTRHPLRVYALLEAWHRRHRPCSCCSGMPLVDHLYSAIAGRRLAGHCRARRSIGAVCLLPPTLLMGATLPAIARWIEATPDGVSWLGFFYGGNIAGAVFGCLLAGFYLLRFYDMATADLCRGGDQCLVAALSDLRRVDHRRTRADRQRASRRPR